MGTTGRLRLRYTARDSIRVEFARCEPEAVGEMLAGAAAIVLGLDLKAVELVLREDGCNDLTLVDAFVAMLSAGGIETRVVVDPSLTPQLAG